ncbi:hypothetical protein CL628_04360 [bacterium]|nr:hypothetical protein [bacterium]
MADIIYFACSKCRATMKAARLLRGTAATCPNCEAIVTVPQQSIVSRRFKITVGRMFVLIILIAIVATVYFNYFAR